MQAEVKETLGVIAVDEEQNRTRMREMLRPRLFNYADPPPPVEPVYTVNGTSICTAGNLAGITAAIKSGKSSWIAAMMAAAMTQDAEADCLGVASSNPGGKALIHVDTEQSRQDWHALVSQAVRRARLEEPPGWLVSYHLTGFTIPDARLALDVIMEEEAARYGGVHSVMIDGVADLVPSVNDEEESLSFISHLHGRAIDYDCPIIGAIHFNPNSDKTRGHLGSQLERKAETNLKLVKEDEVITVYSEKSRKAPISKSEGPRFAWDAMAQMHLSVETIGKVKQDAELEAAKAEAEAAFIKAGKQLLSYGELISNLVGSSGFKSRSTAKRRVGSFLQHKIIVKQLAGLYALNS